VELGKRKHEHRWHQYYVWQLLRRSDLYKKDVNEFASHCRPDSNALRVYQQFKPKNNIAATSRRQFSEITYENLERYLNACFTPRNLEAFNAMGASLYSQSDWNELAKFRRKYDGLIQFPLHPDLINPDPFTLSCFVTIPPAFEIQNHDGKFFHGISNSIVQEFTEKTDALGSSQPYYADVSNEKTGMILCKLNLKFSDDDILLQVKNIIKANQHANRIFKDSHRRWENFLFALAVFDEADHLRAGNKSISNLPWKQIYQRAREKVKYRAKVGDPSKASSQLYRNIAKIIQKLESF